METINNFVIKKAERRSIEKPKTPSAGFSVVSTQREKFVQSTPVQTKPVQSIPSFDSSGLTPEPTIIHSSILNSPSSDVLTPLQENSEVYPAKLEKMSLEIKEMKNELVSLKKEIVQIKSDMKSGFNEIKTLFTEKQLSLNILYNQQEPQQEPQLELNQEESNQLEVVNFVNVQKQKKKIPKDKEEKQKLSQMAEAGLNLMIAKFHKDDLRLCNIKGWRGYDKLNPTKVNEVYLVLKNTYSLPNDYNFGPLESVLGDRLKKHRNKLEKEYEATLSKAST